MAPSKNRQWVRVVRDGENKATFDESAAVPHVGDSDVLVRIKATSLNYRDVSIARGTYPLALTEKFVPMSDAAGVVEAVGAQVTRFKVGDHVMPIFTQAHLAGAANPRIMQTTLGGAVDGVLRDYAAFNEHGLVAMPAGYDFLQGATLPCAALTAWNALYGLESRRLMPGDWVLTQGTGGVSLFALQFAKAAGARVVATTSSAAKADRLRALGADHVVNYRDTPQWGAEARKLTGGVGFAHIVEIGGAGTLQESVNAVAMEGVISVIGFLAAGGAPAPTLDQTLAHGCIVRGILIGSRAQFEAMVQAIEANGIKPVIDDKVFSIEQFEEALDYMEGQKHVGKVCIRVD